MSLLAAQKLQQNKKELVEAHRNGHWWKAKKLTQRKEKLKKLINKYAKCAGCGVTIQSTSYRCHGCNMAWRHRGRLLEVGTAALILFASTLFVFSAPPRHVILSWCLDPSTPAPISQYRVNIYSTTKRTVSQAQKVVALSSYTTLLLSSNYISGSVNITNLVPIRDSIPDPNTWPLFASVPASNTYTFDITTNEFRFCAIKLSNTVLRVESDWCTNNKCFQ